MSKLDQPRRHFWQLIFVSLLLVSGLMSYWFFRPQIKLFCWLDIDGTSGIANREGLLMIFMRNHFADLVWCIAIFKISVILRRLAFPKIYSVALFLMPFVSEFLQLFAVIDGTFDWLDLLIYTLVLTVFLFWGCKNE